MTAKEVKRLINSVGLKQWHVAEFYGISEGNFSRLLRKDPTEEVYSKILKAIDKAEKVYGPK
ncbi:helix-turn-helix domain-containing protein [Paucisalibacillus globulus]|uniref:helix-turn-helix domain-containing protein n=1 Tax=Paucisalibacillus globulus TaxID=351095 RepID=UPI000BB6DA1F|nr:hypothetical protein [Paucisalibacillus globulus]